MNIYRYLVIFCLILFATQSVLWGAENPQYFSLDGNLYSIVQPNTPILDSNISATLQILDASQTCILYEEQQSLDTQSTDGYFNLSLGAPVSGPASNKRTINDSQYSMAQIFTNNTNSLLTGKSVQDGSACSYTPVSGDIRYVHLKMQFSTDGSVREFSPNLEINSVPTALVAESLQGYVPNNFLVLGTTPSPLLTQVNVENIFSNTNYPRLSALISIPTNNYVTSGANGAISIPAIPSDPSSGLSKGQVWYNSTSNLLKYYDGTTALSLGANGGTLTTISVGTQVVMLNGDATISSTGSLTLKNTGTAGSYTKITTDAQGRVMSGGSLIASDIPSLNWSIITAGKPTTLLGYGIVDGVANHGTVPSMQSGTDSSKPTAGTTGSIYIATDSKKIYRDNGTSWDLLSNGTLTNTVLNIQTGVGLTGGAITSIGTINLANTTVTAGSFGNGTTIPNFTVDQQGRLTSAGTSAIPIADTNTTGLLTNSDWNTFNSKLGAVAGSTLSSAKIWVGDSANHAAEVNVSGDVTIDNNGIVSLGTTGVNVGSYSKVTVDTKGRVISAGTINLASDVTGVLATTNGGSPWATSGTNINYVNGFVGIGTASPASTLEVNGNISLSTGTSRIFSISTPASGNGNSLTIKAASGATNTDGGGSLTLAGGNNVYGYPGASLTLGIANGAGSSATLVAGQGDANAAAGTTTIQGGKGGSNTAGGYVNIIGGQGGTNGNDGGLVQITGGSASGANFNGANVLINGGIKTGTGKDGNVILANSRGNVGIGTTSPVEKLEVNGKLRLDGSSSGYVGFMAPASVGTSVIWQLPISDGNSGQVLTTDGAGILSWTNSITTTLVTAGTYGSNISVATFAVDAYGRITSAGTAAIPTANTSTTGLLTSTDWNTFNNKVGAISGSTLSATQIWVGNSSNQANAVNVGGDVTISTAGAVTLGTSGVLVGTYSKVTVDTKGRVTSAGTTDLASTDVTGTLSASKGGTGQASYTTGDLLYATSATSLSVLPIGSSGKVLASSGTSPFWAANGLPANSNSIYQVRLATTGNITLSGTQSIDGVSAAAGDRVLVKKQTAASQNGIYVVNSGAWSRATDLTTWAQALGYKVQVSEGQNWAGMTFSSAAALDGTLNSTNLNWNSSGSTNDSNSLNANGYEALANNTTGNYNTANGNFALFNNTTGSLNTAFGYASLYANTLGSFNTANGVFANYNNTSGSYNSTFGYAAFYSNTTGFYNNSYGSWTQYYNTSGHENAAFGDFALFSNSVGYFNTAIGENALYSTTASRNIGIGFDSGRAITTGSGNVVIGSNTGASIATLSNHILIADGSGNERLRVNDSGNVGIGTTTASTTLTVAGPVALKAPSTINAASYTVSDTDSSLIFTTTSCTVTLPSAASYPGRILYIKVLTGTPVTSASPNVVPLASAIAGFTLLSGAPGKFAMLQSDGTNWIVMMAN